MSFEPCVHGHWPTIADPCIFCLKAEIARLTAERETNEHNAFIAGWEAAFRYGNPEVGLGVVADNAEEAYSLFKERTS